MLFSNLLDVNKNQFKKKCYNFYKILLYVALYKISLDYIYLEIISPVFSYASLTTNIILYKYLLSLLSVIFYTSFIKYFIEDFRPSSIVLLIFYLLFFIPASTVYGIAGLSDGFYIYILIYFFLLSVCLIKINGKVKFKIGCPKTSLPLNIYLFITIITFIPLLVSYNGFNIKLDFKDIYDIRLNAREMDVSPLFSYLKSFASKLFLILLMCALIKKKFFYVGLFTILQLMVYSYAALKSDFIALILVYLIYLLYNDKNRLLVIKGFIGINIFAIFEYIHFGSFVFSAFIQRRVFFIPPRISFTYYDFFSNNELLFLRDSFLRLFGFKSPYNEKASHMIGFLESNDVDSNFNTGLCGDDYSQFGWLSVIIYPLLFVIFLKLYDYLSSGIDGKVILLISVLYAMSFISGSFFMILVTNGFLLLLLLFYLNSYKTNSCQE